MSQTVPASSRIGGIGMANHTILLVEDDDDDVFFLRRALKHGHLDLPIHIASDGQQALDYLSGADPYGNRNEFPLPSVVLLDLKLPYVTGFQVLSWIREQSRLKDMPVFILTSSPEERDRQKAVELGAKGYFVKPPNPSIAQEIQKLLA